MVSEEDEVRGKKKASEEDKGRGQKRRWRVRRMRLKGKIYWLNKKEIAKSIAEQYRRRRRGHVVSCSVVVVVK